MFDQGLAEEVKSLQKQGYTKDSPGLKAIGYQEWFENLAQIDQSLWLPGNTLAGFISPKMPDILLLPWFDDDGKRVALAWCDLTPERRTYITEKSPKTE